ncbi:MAG: TraR/DksA C4-type zinc finger protein [Balneolaceae bacterium]|nr:TraR/DksA C4-type zinc finger protein [Balneolaceae bacterium]
MDQSVVNNSPLSDKELAEFEQRLLKLKEETEAEIETLKERYETLNSNAEDNQSSQAHHQGDIATSEVNREQVLLSIERNKEKLDQIIVALDRIGSGNYGICVETGQPIQKERLEAMPYAIRAVGAK